jgi:UTP:GlnB (protein PII) uridylyltransferase
MQSLDSSTFKYRSLKRSVGVESSTNNTTIELHGTDRPGLLSEIFAVLANHQCNIVASEMWTHNLRMASIVLVTDVATGLPIYDTGRLEKIKQLLSYVLKGSTDISFDSTHVERRLHQIMHTNRDYDTGGVVPRTLRGHVEVTVENCNDRGYTIVNVRCDDRPKLLFDTVCTLTDMEYVIFHATVLAEGSEAYLVGFQMQNNLDMWTRSMCTVLCLIFLNDFFKIYIRSFMFDILMEVQQVRMVKDNE